MLIQFRVGNYRSFSSEVTLSLEAVRAFKEHPGNVAEAERYRLLRSAAIYGANASGKSNLVKAVQFMRECVLWSAERNSVAQIPTQPFRLERRKLAEPCLCEVVLLLDGTTYRYGFETSREEIGSEWLFASSGPRNKESRLFTRERDGIDVADAYAEGKGREADTRSNALFLSTVDQKNGELAHKLMRWFNRLTILSGTNDARYERQTAELLDDPARKESLVDFVRQVDDSILDIVSEDASAPEEPPEAVLPGMAGLVADGRRPSFGLRRQSSLRLSRTQSLDGEPCGTVDFDLRRDESSGTQKILFLAGPWLDILGEGKVAFVDELEAKLHPQLTRRLVRLFNSLESNPKNAQLVFVTHDTNLLTYGGLRRDQVWFCEKDFGGSTNLYSLAEIKLGNGAVKVRKEASFERDYIAGRYGAIPYFGDASLIGGEPE